MATKRVYTRAAGEESTNIAAQITRIQSDRDKIRAKLVTLSLAESTDNLDTLATAIEGIVDNGAVNAEVKEGESYAIPKGYHNGSGTVRGVAGDGNYTLQTKTVTPTKLQQNVTSDVGYYGLSSVTVNAIPEAYQDVTGVTATAADVLSGKTIVSSIGETVAGTMVNNGGVTKTLDTTTTSYTIPKGYHSGSGTVSVVTETKNATPSEEEQVISATTGKVLSSVTVAKIPENYITTDDATATAADIKDGQTAYVDGAKVEGTMPVNAASTQTLAVATTSYIIPAGYHDGAGKVTIVLEEKPATPTKAEQVIQPTTGKVLSKVTVAAIPDEYITTTDATAEAGDILLGETAYVGGTKVTGSMPNNGATNLTIDGMITMTASVPAGYTSGGTVTLTDSIEDALAAI